MNYTEHKITLDIHKTVSQVSLRVKKGDTGRRLLIHFAELGYPYHISEDCYAVFTALKPDGKVVFNDCSIVDCVIIYDFTEQTVAAVGMMDCEIILYGGNGKQLTSASFNIIVEDTVYDKETEIESTNEYNALTALINSANKAATEANEAALTAEKAVSDLLRAKENGEFNGDDYVLTDQDKNEIVDEVIASEEVSKIQKDILDIRAELDYEAIDIIKFSNTAAGTHELGKVIDSLTISWELNKEPASQVLNGETLGAEVRSKEFKAVSTKQTYSLTVTDERNATDKASSSVNFYNGVYYGALTTGVLPMREELLSLTVMLQSGRGATINWTPSDGKRPSYACPIRYGEPKFMIGPNEYEWTKLNAEPIDLENASGYTEPYNVWQHPRDITESITITVS